MASHAHAAAVGESAGITTRLGEGSHGLRATLRELWDARELVYFLVWRDVKVRYKQTAVGVAWVALQPLLMMLLFSIVLGRWHGVAPDGVPYPLFVLSGLVPWQLFSHALTSSTASVVENERLITRVYFPRLIIPIASVLSGFVDALIACLLLVPVAAYYGVAPSLRLAALPAVVVAAMLTAIGLGAGLAALNVRYRDVRYTVGFVVQLWFFATPVAYSLAVVPARWQWVYLMNPVAGVVEGFRWAFLHTSPPAISVVTTWLAVILGVFVAGVSYFRATEQTFADVI